MKFASILNDVLLHAQACMPSECCGVAVMRKRKLMYLPCRNIAQSGQQFVMHPDDFALAEESGEVIAIVHSHPDTNPHPSQADLVGIEQTNLPWLIVNPRTQAHTLTYPSGYKAPLIGREFVHGVADCYTLIQDYYLQTLGIALMPIERQPEWWLKGEDLYAEHVLPAGFYEVDINQIQPHDLIVMRMASPVDNHGAVYIGDGLILQHVQGHLSSRDVYGGYWRKATSKVYRHKDLK